MLLVMLIAETTQQLQRLVSRLTTKSGKYEMKIKVTEVKIMRIAASNQLNR